MQDLKQRIEDAIETHLEWAYDKNDGKMDSSGLSETIMQVVESMPEPTCEEYLKKYNLFPISNHFFNVLTGDYVFERVRMCFQGPDGYDFFSVIKRLREIRKEAEHA